VGDDCLQPGQLPQNVADPSQAVMVFRRDISGRQASLTTTLAFHEDWRHEGSKFLSLTRPQPTKPIRESKPNLAREWRRAARSGSTQLQCLDMRRNTELDRALDVLADGQISLATAHTSTEGEEPRGVKAFVFACICSMYGHADDASRNETSPLNPPPVEW
jgi:hypothetical protein